jgi:LDH2 family malate/lactate/ureidoglycolate dehydrogenase
VELAYDDARRWGADLLMLLGTAPVVADAVSRHLVAADVAGYPSHGIGMLPTYLDQTASGELVTAAVPGIVEERPAHLTVDGNHGFGHYTMEWALDAALATAEDTGVCAVNIMRCGHVGRLGGYVTNRPAAVLACVGTIADLADALVAPPGGREALLGTNPIAFGFPGEPPFVLDMSTSAMAYYQLVRVAKVGGAVPDGVLRDAQGAPTTAAAEILRGGTMQPFGGHKGYGLSIMAGLLGGLATQGEGPAINGAFLLVLHQNVFGGPAADAALDRLRSAEPVDTGRPVRIPGHRSWDALRRGKSRRIPIPDELLDEVKVRLDARGLRFPPFSR